MTTIYEAIMKAADHLERNPSDFSFEAVNIPGGCGAPGCALGWIGYFANARGINCETRNEGIRNVADSNGKALLPIEPGDFYIRMEKLSGLDWMYSAAVCAKGLRLYAAKYHSDSKPKSAIPQSVRAIFDVETA